MVNDDNSLAYKLDGADPVPFFKEFKLGTINLAATASDDSNTKGSNFAIPIDNYKKITGKVSKTSYGIGSIILYTKAGASVTYLNMPSTDASSHILDIDVTEYSSIVFKISPQRGSSSLMTITDLTLK